MKERSDIVSNTEVPEILTDGRSYISAAYAACRIDEAFAAKYRSGTVNYLPYQPQESDLSNVPEHILSVDTGFRLEFDAESVRKERYPYAPSQVSAIFAFGDEDSCKRAHDYYAWNAYWAGEGSLSIRLPKEAAYAGRRTVNTGTLRQFLVEGKLEIVD